MCTVSLQKSLNFGTYNLNLLAGTNTHFGIKLLIPNEQSTFMNELSLLLSDKRNLVSTFGIVTLGIKTKDKNNSELKLKHGRTVW